MSDQRNYFGDNDSLTKKLLKKWQPVLESKHADPITDSYKRSVTAFLLENQWQSSKQGQALIMETPHANMGGGGVAQGAAGGSTGVISGYDPVLISMVRRAAPKLIAYDICGVQPMTQPTGLIFALKARYDSQSGAEALFNEADVDFAGKKDATAGGSQGTGSSADPTSAGYRSGEGMTTTESETLGDPNSGDSKFNEMAITIERTSVIARTRALKSEYTLEVAQDMRAVHGLDIESELSNMLSTEVLQEINREVIRTIYTTAMPGAQNGVNTAGTYDMDVDTDGRWNAEKFKGLLFQIEREANAVGHLTRRGRGNIIICSADIASALALAGVLDYSPQLKGDQLNIDDTSTTFAGVLNGRYKVYIDPYASNVSGRHFFVVGYKGTSPFDAGIFYCPYIPLQVVNAVDPETFQPKIGFKTRYGLVANPFVELDDGVDSVQTDRSKRLVANQNYYYRRVAVTNL